jgi:hypothetical protein
LIDCCSAGYWQLAATGCPAAAQKAKLGTSAFEDFLGDSDWHVDATPLDFSSSFHWPVASLPHFKMQEYCTRA